MVEQKEESGWEALKCQKLGGLEALILRKMSTTVEKGALIFAWNLAAKAPNSGVGEESVGCHRRPVHLQTTGIISSVSSPLYPHHRSGKWLPGSDYPSAGFYSLYFF